METCIEKKHNRIVGGWVKRALALLFTAAFFSFLILPCYVTASSNSDSAVDQAASADSAASVDSVASADADFTASADSATSSNIKVGSGSIAGSGSRKTVRVGWYEASYNFTDQFGRKTGIAYEYQQKVAATTGWKYEYVEGTWPELLKMLIAGEIDLLSDVSYTEERAENILYPSLPMGTESYYIFVNSDNVDLMDDDVKAFEGKSFAVNSGSIQEQMLKDWAENNGIQINIVEITNLNASETIDLLTERKVDAFVALDTYGSNSACMPVFKLGFSDYYLVVSKARPDLLAELDQALRTIQNDDPFFNQRLYEKYIWSFNSGIIFSKEEREWADQRTIVIGYRDKYEPFCFQQNGQVSGALKDYLEAASTCIEGITVNYEAVAFDTTEEALAALNRGEIDAVFPVSMGAYDSEVNGLFVTSPLMKSEIYALVKEDESFTFDRQGVRAVLLEGNVNFDNFIKDYFPDWEVSWRPTLDEVYGAVAASEGDCAMVNGYRINVNDNLRRKHGLVLLDTGEEMGFSFGVRRDSHVLYSLLNKTVAVVDESSVDTMLSKYSNPIKKVTLTDYIQDNLAPFIATLAVIVSLTLFLIITRMKADQKATEKQRLIDATEHDPLTMLYTRNFFFEYAERMHKENPNYKMDAIVTNIEQFHVINALYGWDFGDMILKALGDEIKKYLGENDGIACRSQADRFDIFCAHTDDYQGLFERLQKRLDETSQNVNIRLRMGVMPWQQRVDPVQLFDRARAACSMIRGSQRMRLMVFNEELREKEILEQRLLGDLRYALDNHEFVIYYQPKFKIQTEPAKLWSAEALVRWNHHELGLIPPNDFIALFENSGQIGALDRYVWEETARQIEEWKERYGSYIPVSVNLSRLDVLDPDLEKDIEDIVEKYGIGREFLHLEVTESAYTEGEEQILDVVERLRRKGYHIEMDDFGTGYSSLNMLSHMSIDVLKLDRSFIKDIGQEADRKNERLVELILDIAKSLRLVVVAEGVETKEQLDFLKERGCDLVQGYYFSKPLPAEEFEKKAF